MSQVVKTGKGRPLACAMLMAAVLAFVCASGSVAAPVAVDSARAAVAKWLALDGHRLGADLSGAIVEARVYADQLGMQLYYVISLAPSGFVVTSADDLIEPIVAFSPECNYEAESDSPLRALLMSDLASRVQHKVPVGSPLPAQELAAYEKWSWLLSADGKLPAGGLSSLSDPRVDPLVTSKWSQTVDRSCGTATYNYYTPPSVEGSASNYPCGCVATAMAQLMRYWQYPTAGIGAHSMQAYICSEPTTLITRGGDGSGGPYDWTSMDLDPSCPSLATRQAIGALCFDAGVSVSMNYCSGASGATTGTAAEALRETFGYSSTRIGYNSGADIPSEPRNRMINANLHAGFPIILGIRNPTAGIGHAVVCDGYGYDSSTMYHHLNLGWAGYQTAWYNLPMVDASPYTFTAIHTCVYNVFTTGSGEIIAGRVADCFGVPVAGAAVTANGFSDTTDSRGIYALAKFSSGSTVTVSVQKAGYTFASKVVTAGSSADYSTACGNQWPVDFAASCVPIAPSDPGATNVTTSSIRWTWTDNSSTETGFKIYADQGTCLPLTLSRTTSSNATYWDYASLSANCGYCFQVAATNGIQDSTKTDCIPKYTLAGQPSYPSNIYCDRSTGVWYPAGTTFTFTNPAGFGTCGQYRASKFGWVMDTNPTHTWTGSEPEWSSGSLAQTPTGTGTYYLHLRSFNAESVANPTALDLGPYGVDVDLPSTPAVTDDGTAQLATNSLHAAWSSSDASTGICEYKYAIGAQATDPGSGYVVAWKSAGTATQATETGLSLQMGSIYYWYVKAVDCAGNSSAVGVSDGIAAVQMVRQSVRAARILADNQSIGLTSRAVSAVYDDAFYVQDPAEPFGLRVQADHIPAGLSPGKLVDVAGKMLTNPDGERYMQACVRDTFTTAAVRPAGMRNDWLGGADWDYSSSTGAGQRGVTGGSGLNNIGLLVRTWGRVKSVVADEQGDSQVVQSWDFDTNPGWTMQGQWAWGAPTGAGTNCLDPTSGYTGSNVIGYNLSGDYAAGIISAYHATTSAIDCSTFDGVQLQFRRWLSIESSSYDHAGIQVSNDGIVWTSVWSNPTTKLCDAAWTLQTYDISAAADLRSTVYIRWSMGPTDATVVYPGWNIDDVVVTGLASHKVIVDDGSSSNVMVAYPSGAQLPAVGSFVTVTGISSCSKDEEGNIKRLVRALP